MKLSTMESFRVGGVPSPPLAIGPASLSRRARPIPPAKQSYSQIDCHWRCDSLGGSSGFPGVSTHDFVQLSFPDRFLPTNLRKRPPGCSSNAVRESVETAYGLREPFLSFPRGRERGETRTQIRRRSDYWCRHILEGQHRSRAFSFSMHPIIWPSA